MSLDVVGIPSGEAFGEVAGAIADWWRDVYPYRRSVVISASTSQLLPLGHPVDIVLPLASTLDQGKLQEDFDDVTVVSPMSTQLGRMVWTEGDDLFMRFRLDADISAGETATYHVYYGNQASVTQPAFVDDPWPIHVANDSSLISYTRPEEDWRDGETSTRGAKAVADLEASALRLLVDRRPTGGLAEVQLDDGPWEPVDLFAPVALPNVEVWSAEGLASGSHRVRYRSTGYANPSSQGTRVNLQAIEYRATIDVVVGVEEVSTSAWRVAGVGGGGA